MDAINKSSRWQIRVAALVIFLLGFIAGALSLNLYNIHRSAAAPAHGSHGGGFEDVMARLNLSEQQKVEVGKIMADARNQFKDRRKEFEDARKQIHARLQAVLTPEQWQLFEQIMKERRSHWHHHDDSAHDGSDNHGDQPQGGH